MVWSGLERKRKKVFFVIFSILDRNVFVELQVYGYSFQYWFMHNVALVI
jgi:hypothetical protein